MVSKIRIRYDSYKPLIQRTKPMWEMGGRKSKIERGGYRARERESMISGRIDRKRREEKSSKG